MVNDDQNSGNKGDKEYDRSFRQPPNTLLREEVMNLNGQDIVSWTESFVRKEDGSMVRQTRNNHQIASDGRWVRMDEFIAISWTGLAVPKDSVASCLNPFERHGHRLVYINLDSKITELGNVLCTECFERQKMRLFWKKVLFFGLIYNPKEY